MTAWFSMFYAQRPTIAECLGCLSSLQRTLCEEVLDNKEGHLCPLVGLHWVYSLTYERVYDKCG
jgi:hypothetical protein